MQNIPNPLVLAQEEIQRTARSQDLIEVPKRARLDRQAEARERKQLDEQIAEEHL